MTRRIAFTPPIAIAPAPGADGGVRCTHRWTRLSSLKWEDVWTERLRFVGPENVVFVNWPDSNALKIEAYCDERRAKELVRRFGGRATKLLEHVWTGNPARPRGPLSIRGKLKIFSDQQSWRDAKRERSRAARIFIPAGMAFGTGEHATTATCLRLLTDIAGDLLPNFSALDLGTGAGVLAIAAKALGAARVEAVDYDPIAVRIARHNASVNGFPTIGISQGDVLKLKIRKRYDVVLANLFSDVLAKAAPRIARLTKPGGWLVFSGVLRGQMGDVSDTFQAAGFARPHVVARGKWCAASCQRDPN
jgi:ribosomal protein L11 methyltransferase